MTDLGLSPLHEEVAAREVVPAPPATDVAHSVWRVVTRLATSSVVLGAFLAAATWPGGPAALSPYAGLDGSWQAALAMAAHRGIPFGTRIIWTYGPLGFLTSGELYYPGTAMLAFLFKFALSTAIFTVFVSALRRHLPLVAACVAAYFVGYPIAAMWFGSEAVLAVMLVVCVGLLSRTDDPSATKWWWIGFGAASGLMVLEKLSLGIGIFALAAIAIACAPIRRRGVAALLTLVPFVAVFITGWFGTGNDLGNVAAYVRGAREAAAGYSAISLDPPNRPHDIVLAVAIAIAILVTAGFYARSLLADTGEPDGRARGSRFTRATAFGIVASTALVVWMLFKEAFVRQDGHRLVYFASIPLILAAFMLDGRRAGPHRSGDPATSRWGSSAMCVGALLLSAMAALVIAGAVPPSLVDPTTSLSGFKGTVHTLVSPARRDAVMAEARTTMRNIYGIPPSMISTIGTQTVDIDPVEQNVAWAYPQLRWDPLPTIQGYFAYTPALDHDNVAYVTSKRAPDFILRQVQSSVDGGLPVFGEPATQVAIACNYRRVADSAGWLLLKRTRNRCGAMQQVGRTHAAFGGTITVPRADPGEMIVATFDLHLPVWWHLLDAAYKPPTIWVTIDGGLPTRFVEATASDAHVLRLASTQDFPAIFSPPPVRRLTLTSHGAGGSKHGIDVTFYEIPVS